MIPKRFFTIAFALCIITYVLGMVLIPLMDIDASQYASISREMLENNSWLQVFDLRQDYLDKPPMLFWLSAISMKILGIHDWAYRLPSFLFALLAVYATYRLAALFYRKEIAQLSALVLATCQAMFLITHDVRTDTMLMGWVALSLWQMAAWYETGKWKYFIVAFVSIACGMMTKGPIALLVPAFAFVPHFVLQRGWKQLFRWEYLAGVVIIAVMLVPMSIGLYRQFDMHPGKMINGVPIQSGLRFYYWTQSFGRYTGENVFNEMNHFTFLLENMIWSFIPWILFFLPALVLEGISLVKKKFRLNTKEEWISTGGFIITYCILARSQAQLPHYIFVVFPLASIITAKFLFRVLFTDELIRWKKIFITSHLIIFTLLWMAVAGLMFWPFKQTPVVYVVTGFCMAIYLILLFRKRLPVPKLLVLAIVTVTGVNIFLNTGFYPNVLKYQLGNDAAVFIEKSGLRKDRVNIYGINEGRALHFYARHIFSRKGLVQDFQPQDLVLTDRDSTAVFRERFPEMKLIHEGPRFGVTALSLPFLDPVKRDKEVPKYVIIDLDGK
jgi:4-amino-4-deoxy-L-arabinose transferase-like glycosyltransferase